MSSQILVPETTDMGGLFSITDEYAQYSKGFKFQKVDNSGNVATIEYLYNAVGAAVAAGVFYPKFHGAAALSPAGRAPPAAARAAGAPDPSTTTLTEHYLLESVFATSAAAGGYDG